MSMAAAMLLGSARNLRMQVFDTIAKFWACIDEGAWAEDRQLVRKPHAVLTTSYHNRLYTIKPAW